MDFSGGSDSKESTCNAGDPGSVPGLGRSPGEGSGNWLQYSCPENPKDGGTWQVTLVHGVTKSGPTEWLTLALPGTSVVSGSCKNLFMSFYELDPGNSLKRRQEICNRSVSAEECKRCQTQWRELSQGHMVYCYSDPHYLPRLYNFGYVCFQMTNRRKEINLEMDKGELKRQHFLELSLQHHLLWSGGMEALGHQRRVCQVHMNPLYSHPFWHPRCPDTWKMLLRRVTWKFQSL